MFNDISKILVVGIGLIALVLFFSGQPHEEVAGEITVRLNKSQSNPEKPLANLEATEETGNGRDLKAVTYGEYLEKIGGTFSEPISLERGDDTSPELDEISRKLKEYGNRAGEIIKNGTPESEFQLKTFKKFIDDSKNTENISNMHENGAAYVEIGELLSKIEAPEQINQASTGLASVYKSVGIATSAFASNFSDDADKRVSTEDYNRVISNFPDAFLSVASILRAYGIEFRESESGSVFTLPI